MSFKASLQVGKVGESAIAQWMRARGWYVLPIYEKELGQGKGPQLYTPETQLIGTDMLAFRGGKTLWIEAKHKSAFTWHRNTARWTTGIDLRHYADYCRIDDETPWPVWLLFLHRDGRAKDTPPDMVSPTGLFGGTLDYLRKHENHRSDKWAKGMVYWAVKRLRLIARLEDVLACNGPRVDEITSSPVHIVEQVDAVDITW